MELKWWNNVNRLWFFIAFYSTFLENPTVFIFNPVLLFWVIMMRFLSSTENRGTRRSGGGSSGAASLLWPLLGACLWAAVFAYRPVVIVHGLFDSSGDFKNLQRFINEVSGRTHQMWSFRELTDEGRPSGSSHLSLSARWSNATVNIDKILLC